MPQLYNVQTRQPEDLDGEALQNALAAGTHAYAAGDSVTVTSPDGITGTIPATNVQQAISQGYKPETPTQEAIRQAVDEYKTNNPGIKGSLKVFGAQMADEALFGIPEMIYNKKADPLDVAKKEAIKKEYQMSNLAGGVAGFGANLLAAGPLFKGAAAAGDVAAEQIASRLGAAAGENLGSRTVASAAKDIAAKIISKGVGGTVEGALITAPHAITEAALGDPGDAAESLLAGGAIGGILGGGGEVVKGLFKVGNQALKKAAALAGKAEPTTQAAARTLANVFTGVDKDAVQYYADNVERITANPPPDIEGAKDLIDSAVQKRVDALEEAKDKFQTAQRQSDEAYGFSRQDLSKARAPVEVAQDLQGALNNQKAVLGELSDKADDILANSGATFSKNDVLKFAQDVKDSLGIGEKKALIGDEAVAASKKMDTMIDRIETGLPDQIDAPTMRDVVRQIRKDINYNQLAGEFNDTVNSMKKTFTGKLNDLIKDQSPEFATLMKEMQERSEVLGQMSKNFGSPERAVSSLNAILTPAGQLKSELLDRFGQLNGKDYLAELEDVRNAKSLLEESRVKDVRDKLIPEVHANTAQAEAEYLKAKAAYDEVKRLGQNRTESIIKRKLTIEDQRALEKLGATEGTDFNQMLKDRHVLDAFHKDTTRGSRKTNLLGILGGAAGFMVGGPAGAAVGASAGATAGAALDPYGGMLLKKMIETQPKMSGLLFVEQQMKKTAEKLDTLPEILDKMASKVPGPGVKATTIGAIGRAVQKDYIPDVKNPALVQKERVKHLEKVNSTVANLVGNPQRASDAFASLAHPVSDNGAPQIGGAFSQKLAAASAYLSNQIPRPPNPISPFAPQVTFRPSDAQVTAFEQKLAVVQDPFIVLNELQNGTLTKNHMEALKAVYPYIHSQMQKKVQEAVIKGVKPISYQHRLKLSMLMDAPMDKSMNTQSIGYFQQSFSANPQGMDEKNGFKVDLASNAMTDTQRITQGG